MFKKVKKVSKLRNVSSVLESVHLSSFFRFYPYYIILIHNLIFAEDYKLNRCISQ